MIVRYTGSHRDSRVGPVVHWHCSQRISSVAPSETGMQLDSTTDAVDLQLEVVNQASSLLAV